MAFSLPFRLLSRLNRKRHRQLPVPLIKVQELLYVVIKTERETRCSTIRPKQELFHLAGPAADANDSGKATPEFVYKRERDSTSCDFP